jgi:hypothetical protein
LLVPVLFAFQSLVAGENCPATIDVEARVRTILHLTPEQVLSEGFIVERHEAGLYVELRSADSTLIGQRTLPAEGNCDELAQAAAVVLSAWLSDVHPDFAGALPAPAAPPAAESAPPPALPPPPPTPPAPQPQAVSANPQAPPPPPRRWEVSFGLGGDVSGGASFAGMLGVTYAPPWQGFGLSATAIFSLPHEEQLGPGLVEWRRWPLGVGPGLRLGNRNLGWEFGVGPTLAWLHLTGANFDRPSSKDDVAVGGFLNARLSTRARLGGLFGLAAAQFYPGENVAHASQADVEWSAPLPGFAVNLLVGGWLAP